MASIVHRKGSKVSNFLTSDITLAEHMRQSIALTVTARNPSKKEVRVYALTLSPAWPFNGFTSKIHDTACFVMVIIMNKKYIMVPGFTVHGSGSINSVRLFAILYLQKE